VLAPPSTRSAALVRRVPRLARRFARRLASRPSVPSPSPSLSLRVGVPGGAIASYAFTRATLASATSSARDCDDDDLARRSRDDFAFLRPLTVRHSTSFAPSRASSRARSGASSASSDGARPPASPAGSRARSMARRRRARAGAECGDGAKKTLEVDASVFSTTRDTRARDDATTRRATRATDDKKIARRDARGR